jgi:hypothetical protein
MRGVTRLKRYVCSVFVGVVLAWGMASSALADCAAWTICDIEYSRLTDSKRVLLLDAKADLIHALGYYYNWIEVGMVKGVFQAVVCFEGSTPVPDDLKTHWEQSECVESSVSAVETLLSSPPPLIQYWPVTRSIDADPVASGSYAVPWILRTFSDPATNNVFGP